MTATINVLAINALEMIAGERLCLDGLLSDKDVARQTLAALREASPDCCGLEPVLYGNDKFAPHERPQKQPPIGWTHKDNLIDDGYGHNFTVHSSEPACGDFVPVYADPVGAKDIRNAALNEALEIALTIGGDFAVRFRVALESIR